MGMLTAADAGEIERAITSVEARVDAQIVVAVVPRSDDFPEIPWRAFGLGVALAALVLYVVHLSGADGWEASVSGWPLTPSLVLLGSGALFAAATLVAPPIARLFVGGGRLSGEAHQRAQAMFLEREVFATPHRNGVLLMLSEFERRVVLVPDTAFRGRVSDAEWQAIVDRIIPGVTAGQARQALLDGLIAVEGLLESKGAMARHRENPLPNTLVRGELR